MAFRRGSQTRVFSEDLKSGGTGVSHFVEGRRLGYTCGPGAKEQTQLVSHGDELSTLSVPTRSHPLKKDRCRHSGTSLQGPGETAPAGGRRRGLPSRR